MRPPWGVPASAGTDSLFGLPLLVSTFDSSGHLVSVTFMGMSVTGLFAK
jgi:hypothetical protein